MRFFSRRAVESPAPTMRAHCKKYPVIARSRARWRGALSAKREEVPLGCNPLDQHTVGEEHCPSERLLLEEKLSAELTDEV